MYQGYTPGVDFSGLGAYIVFLFLILMELMIAFLPLIVVSWVVITDPRRKAVYAQRERARPHRVFRVE